MVEINASANPASDKPLSDRAAQVGGLLLPLLGLLIPLSGPAGTAAAILIVVATAVRGNFGEHFRPILSNRVALSVLVLVVLHVIGLLWTEHLRSGFHMVNKQWRLLLIPVLMTFVRKDHLQLYIDSFIAGMTATMLVSYLYIFHFVSFEIMDRISYNPLLAFCIYLIGYSIFFSELPRWKRLLYSVLALSMTLNMFLTKGRTGYLAFLMMMLLLFFQYFGRRRLKAFCVSLLCLAAVLVLSYHYSSVFRQRIDGAVNEVTSFKMNRVSPDGNDRITFYLNTLDIVKDHPLLGVGTGDFADAYEKVNRIQSPSVFSTDDPHNGYLLVLAQFGVPGLAALMAIFFFQFQYALSADHRLRPPRVALPVFFMVISLFGSYLLGHFTAIAFAYFTAVFYRNCNAVA